MEPRISRVVMVTQVGMPLNNDKPNIPNDHMKPYNTWYQTSHKYHIPEFGDAQDRSRFFPENP
jgi:hypothetical protein